MNLYRDMHQVIHEKPGGKVVLWRVSGYGLIENEKGEILMVTSGRTGRLDLPGGGVNVEESLRDGIVRECLEETGYDVVVDDQPFFVGENKCFDIIDEQFQHVLLLTYQARIISGDPSKSQPDSELEVADVRWVHPSVLTEDMVQPIHWSVIQLLQTAS